jgi:hypothetical protein
MKKILSFLVVFASLKAFSQSSISLGPDLGLPSNFSKTSKTSLGASLEYVNKFSKHVGLRVFTAYNRFEGKYVADDVLKFIPYRIGIEGFAYKDVFLVYGEVGAASLIGNGPRNSKTNFSYGLGAGYRYPIGMTKQFIQLSGYYNFFRFDEMNTYTWFNIRLAYGFNFGRKAKSVFEE